MARMDATTATTMQAVVIQKEKATTADRFR
jgi:hypothetical protein